MRRPALLTRLKARPRLRRAVVALTAVVAALTPFAVTGLQPAAAVAPGGATYYSWVRQSNVGTDWWGNWVGGNYNPAADQGKVIYKVDDQYNRDRIKYSRYFVGGFLWAGNGYHCYDSNCADNSGGNGLWPRTLTITDPDNGQPILNKTFLENDCDYYGIAFGGSLNFGRQDYPAGAKTNPWYGYGGAPWENEGGWWYWASNDYTRDDDPAGNGNTWWGPAGSGWYYTCERNFTDRWLATDWTPDGSLDGVTNTAGGTLQISGWAADRDQFARDSYTVTVDGRAVRSNALTDAYRPDVQNAMNGAYDGGSRRFTDTYGFDFTVTGLSSGNHTVCASAHDVVPSDWLASQSGDRNLGCKTVLVDQPPVAVDDTASSWKATPVTVDVLANDSDPDHDPLTVTAVTNGQYGTAKVSGNQVVYTPNGVVGDKWDTVTYTVSDGHLTDTATVTVWVDHHSGPNCGTTSNGKCSPPGQPGQAGTDNANVFMGTTTPIHVLANDIAPTGMIGTSTISFGGLLTSPQKGTVTVDAATGTIYYTPSYHFGDTDSFTYSSCLTNVNYLPETQCNPGTVNVTVTNRQPTAQDFTVTATPGQTIPLPFAAHIDDVDGDALSVNPVTQPSVGTLAWSDAAGTWTYTAPLTHTAGEKTSFTYTATDGFPTNGVSATHTVTILLPYVVRPS